MNSEYKVTIGLEIHAELKTLTKMFCNSKNNPDEKRPNVNICPICMGYPGTLPTINKEAVKNVIKVGLAIGGEIADHTEFDRKNYFYPDIPKGYQISQYKYPLVRGGVLNGVAITRVHLEEDTARSSHPERTNVSQGDTTSYGTGDGGYSLLDFNRAGIPLMELVTEPVISSAEEASAFAKELQLLLQYLGVAEANMEKGEMRVEANISVSKTDKFGTKVEVKNINSFKAVEKAVAYEVDRHISILEDGGKVEQETRGWDENKEITFGQRSKEESHDYRYFPDPDLPKLVISEIPDLNPNLLKKDFPELPWERRKALLEKGLKAEDAEMLVRNPNWDKYFQAVSKELKDEEKIKTAVNYLTSDFAGLVKGDDSTDMETVDISKKIPSEHFSSLITMTVERSISSRATKDILKIMYEEGGEPEKIASERGLMQKSDSDEIEKIARDVVKQNQSVVDEYKKGKESALQFLIGQGMKISKGSANPEVLKSILIKILS